MKLSAQQLEQFDEEGYVVVEDALRYEDLDPVIEEYDRFVAEKARELYGECQPSLTIPQEGDVR